MSSSEDFSIDMLNSSLSGVLVVNPGTSIRYINQTFEELTGFTAADLIGKKAPYPWWIDSSNKGIEILKEGMHGGHTRYEAQFQKKNGKRFWVDLNSTPIKKDGKLRFFLSSWVDITDRKHAEEALRDSEEFMSSLLNNLPNPMLVLYPDTSIRYVNPALEELTSFTSAELIGKKAPYPWWSEETLQYTNMEVGQALYQGLRRFKRPFRKKNGEIFWCEVTTVPVFSSGELKYSLSSWRDITESERLRNNMQFYISEITNSQEEERKRIAHELHDETVQSLAVLSHDIETIISRERDQSAIQQLERLKHKVRSTMQAVRDFCHELRPDVIDRLGLTPALELLTTELNNENGIKACMEIVGSERRLLPGVELALFRIAQEALRNVWRHSQATEAEVSIEFTSEEIKLNITDNGKGFIVSRFLSDFASRGKLGLCGMQERARLLGGDLSVESEPSKGTTIKVKVKV